MYAKPTEGSRPMLAAKCRRTVDIGLAGGGENSLALKGASICWAEQARYKVAPQKSCTDHF